jgi:hypothetical protein
MNLRESCFRGFRLRNPSSSITLCEECLPLQIRQLDEISIDDDKRADSGSGELLRSNAPKRTAASEQNACLTQSLLSLSTKPRKLHLP